MANNQDHQQLNIVNGEAVEPNEAWLMQLAAIDENEDVGFIGVEDDRFSFEDSERFEEDSLCSLPSETGSLNHKWRGWAAKNNSAIISTAENNPIHLQPTLIERSSRKEIQPQSNWRVKSLAEIAASKAAKTLSFEAIESIYQSIKPMNTCQKEDIRLYSCLANGNANQFSEGEHLYQAGAVGEIFQIGYHLSAIVNVYDEIATSESNYRVIWIVLQETPNCLMIFRSGEDSVMYVLVLRVFFLVPAHCGSLSTANSPPRKRRIPTNYLDSITELSDDKLKKLAQYLINELPREDFDQLVKPSPTVHCDVQYLSSTSPPASNEWNTLIRPLRSKEPEALWNLLSIVREMLKRGDENATTLLHIITEQCMSIDPVLIWWYQTCLTQSGYWHFSGYRNHTLHSHVSTTQYNAGSLCDEIVKLWRLAALNPKLSSFEREQLASLLQLYHRTAVHHIWRIIGNLSVDHYLSQNIER
uniref:ZSWIM8 TPR repeats domain-containing protein n=1 Tax=Ditylenchus dipsaci TaxID=166011 RepID=A0A915EG49_9BILA